MFHLFGAYGVIAYQTGALFAAWATCLLLFQMARTVTSRGGALFAGMLYSTGLTLCGGDSGQTPVFYTLLVTAAMALFFFKVIRRPYDPQHVRRIGIYAMGLFGISMQIKYTTMFEGIFLGLYLIWVDLKNKRKSIDFITDIAAWVGVALMPTALVFLCYALIGHGQEWIFANFSSIFLRTPASLAEKNYIELKILKTVAPLIVGGIISVWLFRKAPQKSERRFISLWALASCLGVIIFGFRYDHYLLPTFAPLALVNCIFWNRTGGRYWLVILLLAGTFRAQKHIHTHILENGDASAYHALLAAMPDPKGCLFIYDGSTAFYDTPHWCALTNHPFPPHFSELSEIHATGMNPFSELKRILLQKPKYIMMENPPANRDNQEVRTYLQHVLSEKYKEIYQYKTSSKSIIIYQSITP